MITPQLKMRRWTGQKGPWKCHVPRGVPVVYALLDAHGAALYVGQTSQLANRLRSHRAPRSRTNAHVSWVATEHPDLASAVEAEARAIHALQPPLNVAGR